MRILLINHYAVPERGSFGTRHAVLARFLRELGHEVTVMASAIPDGRHETVPVSGLFADRIEGGVHFRFIRTNRYRSLPGRFLSMLLFRARAVRASSDLRAPDVVIGSSVHLHAADAGRRIAHRFGVPFVFEVRDVWPEVFLDMRAMSRRNPVYQYLRFLELRLYREAVAVITLLPGMKEYLRAHGVSEQRIWYIPNGVDTALFEEPRPPPPAPPFVVSYFGAHGPANGLDTVIRAAAVLKRAGAAVKFRLVGDGSRKPALRALASELGIGPDLVEFLDPVPKVALQPLATATHAFVFHLKDLAVLRRYGLSANKLFDYLLAGRPILFACRAANNPVEEAQAGLIVPPEDPEALADAALRLSRTPQAERDSMGRRGREWVREHHDLRRLAGRLASHLEQVVGARSD